MNPIRVTPQMFRDIIERFGFMPGVDVEWQWLTAAADRIEALQAALCDAAALLPPERWELLQPSTREALDV